MEKINSPADFVERIVERTKNPRAQLSDSLRYLSGKESALREKLIVDQQKLIDFWVKNAEGRKASLLADLKGGEFRFPTPKVRLILNPKSKTTFMIDWDKLISEIKKAGSLEDAYKAFLKFHEVVDESLALTGEFYEIWEEFIVSSEKKDAEKSRVSDRKEARRHANYGIGAVSCEYHKR